MDAELRDKWVAALRSGKYKQGQINLRSSDDRFCCLGVLADVINPENWSQLDGPAVWGDDGFSSVYTLRQSIIADDACFPLVEMNDAEGKSFNEIADYISAQNPEDL